MKYRATLPGFIDRRIRPGDVIDVEGEPPIQGLVPVLDEPIAEPVIEAPAEPRSSRRSRRQSVAVDPSDEPDVI